MIDRLQTEIQIPPITRKIRHSDRILLFGSCFADEIGERMTYSGFNLLRNPTGTLYNPASIGSIIRKTAESKLFTPEDVFCKDGLFSSFFHHGSRYGTTCEGFLNEANNTILNAGAFLHETDIVIITLGSAHIYRNRADGQVVANCHKFPKDTFSEEVLSVEECCSELESAIKTIRRASSKEVQFIFTVSPIRHIRDGLHNNRISKSILLLATDRLCRENEDCCYFPSYEIMEDELRDYRFYAEDLCHPTKTAADYIWKRFMDFSMNEETRKLIKEIDALQKSRNHRILFPESEAGKKFTNRLEEQLKEFREKHPEVIL